MKRAGGNKKLGRNVLKNIRVLLTDVDGCLTDSRLFYVPDGRGGMAETKGFSSQDGMAFRWLIGAGVKVGWISGRDSPATVERAQMLGIHYIYQNHLEKLGPYAEIKEKSGVADEEVCYIGDDLPDAPIMLRAGFAVAPANSAPEIKAISHYVTKAEGGYGAAREVIELILKAQGKWDAVLEKYGVLGKARRSK
jgi:3-deoxy-D-manno-octulosonate 8-phosphate phosphatase (KDO 8-P phosphatase)